MRARPDETQSTLRNEFHRAGYAIARGLVDRALADTLWWYASSEASGVRLRSGGDSQVPGTPASYSDPVMERMLVWLQPSIERLTGIDLYPTYSYCRIYKQGDVLAKHVDRPSCEVSVSLNLGQSPPEPWPFGIENPHGRSFIELAPGDAVLYQGRQCPHWRDAYGGQRLGQVFLHYVNRHGQCREWVYDKRKALRVLEMSSCEPLAKRLAVCRAVRYDAPVSTASPFGDP